MAGELSQLTRQRVDYVTLPNGHVKAILTVSLPGGVVKRYETTVDPNEALVGYYDAAEVGSFFGGIARFAKHAVHSIGKVAKAVVTSKVFAIAASALATAIPGVGPALGPAMLAASGALGVASKLTKASIAHKHGAPAVAKALTLEAVADAHKITSTPAAARALLDIANEKRLKVEKISGLATVVAPKAPAATAPAMQAPAMQANVAPSGAALLGHARLGRIRSNRPGPISEQELLRAHQSGRVFWVA